MALKIQRSTVTVATAGTRTQITSSSTYAVWAYFESVAGTIYLGDSGVSSTNYMCKLAAGVGREINLTALNMRTSVSGTGAALQLNTLYADSAGNGDKLQVTYLERLGTS